MARKAVLTLILLMLFTVPAAQCFTVNAPNFNFQATHGGNVRFAHSFTSTQHTWATALTSFSNLITGGNNLGNMAFDCDTGVNMTITDLSKTSITYTVTGTGIKHSYLMNPKYDAPLLYEGALNLDYDSTSGLITVTHLGSKTITITWGQISSNMSDAAKLVAGFFGLFAIAVLWEHIKHGGDIKITLIGFAISLAIIVYVASLIAGMGY